MLARLKNANPATRGELIVLNPKNPVLESGEIAT